MNKLYGDKYNLIMPYTIREHVQRMALRHGKSEAEVYRAFITLGIEIYDIYEPFGPLHLSEVLQKARKAVKESIQPKIFTEG